MGWIKTAWRWFWNHLQNIALLGGWAVSFGVPAWAAKATDWLVPYGPIAWVAAGLIGVLVFALLLALVSMLRQRWILGTVQKQFYEKTDRINPMDSHFFRKRIRLEDLLPPGSAFVIGKTFEHAI